MNENGRGSFPIRVLRGAVRIIVGVPVVIYTVLDELLFPLFRPVLHWLGGLRVFERVGALIGALPPYVARVTLSVPCAAIEPAKVYALYLVAVEHPITGIGLLLVAQVLSLLVCERIYHAAHGPLMRIGWFGTVMGWVVRLRERAMGWVRLLAGWQMTARLARSLRQWLAGLVNRLH